MKRTLSIIALTLSAYAAGRGTAHDAYVVSTRAAELNQIVVRGQHAALEAYRMRFVTGLELRRDELQHRLWIKQYARAEELTDAVNEYLRLRAANE